MNGYYKDAVRPALRPEIDRLQTLEMIPCELNVQLDAGHLNARIRNKDHDVRVAGQAVDVR